MEYRLLGASGFKVPVLSLGTATFGGTNEFFRGFGSTDVHWLLTRPTVANVIIGARNAEQLRQNLSAIGWSLTPPQIAALDAASAAPVAYPYWHQRSIPDLNPKPV